MMADTNAWNSQQARSLRDDFYFMTALTYRVDQVQDGQPVAHQPDRSQKANLADSVYYKFGNCWWVRRFTP